MISLAGMSLRSNNNSLLVRATRHDVEMMRKYRPLHPLTLQAACLLARHQERDEGSLRMNDGYESAMHQYADPAQAAQHLLHCMYSELLVCLYIPRIVYFTNIWD